MDPTDNFARKADLIHARLQRIDGRRMGHHVRFRRMRKVSIISKCILNVLNTISVTSIVMQFSGEPTTLIVCAATSTLSTLGTALMSVIDLEGKYHSHHTSYLQLTQLYDDNVAKMLQDDLDGPELDRILTSINARMGLILESSEPLPST